MINVSYLASLAYIPRYGIYDLVNIPSFQRQKWFSIDFPTVVADKKLIDLIMEWNREWWGAFIAPRMWIWHISGAELCHFCAEGC